MTEVDWFACEDRRVMLNFLSGCGKFSERKARLFAVACCRRIWPLLPDEMSRRVVEVAERFADGLATREELCEAWPLPAAAELARDWAKAVRFAADAAQLAGSTESTADLVGQVSYYAAGAVAWQRVGPASRGSEAGAWAAAWTQAEAGEYLEQVGLLRDLVGNPFRPAVVDPSWRTPDVVTLAGHIYQDRAFSDLPELGRALADAGCTETMMLDHCQGPGPHAGGCVVLDAILGRS